MPGNTGYSNLFRHACEIKHNTKVKQFPDGNSIVVASKPIFTEPGWEKACDEPKKPKNMDNEVRADNIGRAKQKVYDIARLNSFRWFIYVELSDEQAATFIVEHNSDYDDAANLAVEYERGCAS